MQLAAWTVSQQLDSVAGQLSTHMSSDDHDPRYYTKGESNTQFAPASHDHNADYRRQVGFFYGVITNNTPPETLGTVDVLPEGISLSVKHVLSQPWTLVAAWREYPLEA